MPPYLPPDRPVSHHLHAASAGAEPEEVGAEAAGRPRSRPWAWDGVDAMPGDQALAATLGRSRGGTPALAPRTPWLEASEVTTSGRRPAAAAVEHGTHPSLDGSPAAATRGQRPAPTGGPDPRDRALLGYRGEPASPRRSEAMAGWLLARMLDGWHFSPSRLGGGEIGQPDAIDAEVTRTIARLVSAGVHQAVLALDDGAADRDTDASFQQAEAPRPTAMTGSPAAPGAHPGVAPTNEGDRAAADDEGHLEGAANIARLPWQRADGAWLATSTGVAAAALPDAQREEAAATAQHAQARAALSTALLPAPRFFSPLGHSAARRDHPGPEPTDPIGRDATAEFVASFVADHQPRSYAGPGGAFDDFDWLDPLGVPALPAELAAPLRAHVLPLPPRTSYAEVAARLPWGLDEPELVVRQTDPGPRTFGGAADLIYRHLESPRPAPVYASLQPTSLTPSEAEDAACALCLDPLDELHEPVAVRTRGAVHLFEFSWLMRHWRRPRCQTNPLNRQSLQPHEMLRVVRGAEPTLASPSPSPSASHGPSSPLSPGRSATPTG